MITFYYLAHKKEEGTYHCNEQMPGFLSPGKGVPLLIPEYSGINKGQRVPGRSKTARRKPLVKCFLIVICFFFFPRGRFCWLVFFLWIGRSFLFLWMSCDFFIVVENLTFGSYNMRCLKTRFSSFPSICWVFPLCLLSFWNFCNKSPFQVSA